MRIEQIPILADNYAYLIHDDEAGTVLAVDPAEPTPVLAAIAESGSTLTHILCTHHHWDHAGGNRGMLDVWPDAQVVGSGEDAEKIEGISLRVAHKETRTFGGLNARILAVPCHTRGHVAYLFEDALFCGDTLFVAGCGRFFEGNAREMHEALNGILGSLPGETRVYCGHEYTVSNLAFALHIEPHNDAARAKMAWARKRREEGRSTVPSTLAEEKTYNPFMRVDEADVQRACSSQDSVEVMARLRELKNDFRPPTD
jgi:hydroxyacylglutathione hydrolase